mmetsp:Transcript_23091/g.57179  ORF Transcript_23091/g.57179 Transcript_23091/m.57179 type:complete len:402 (-) Transcript_23091:1424-2629(-)
MPDSSCRMSSGPAQAAVCPPSTPTDCSSLSWRALSDALPTCGAVWISTAPHARPTTSSAPPHARWHTVTARSFADPPALGPGAAMAHWVSRPPPSTHTRTAPLPPAAAAATTYRQAAAPPPLFGSLWVLLATLAAPLPPLTGHIDPHASRGDRLVLSLHCWWRSFSASMAAATKKSKSSELAAVTAGAQSGSRRGSGSTNSATGSKTGEEAQGADPPPSSPPAPTPSPLIGCVSPPDVRIWFRARTCPPTNPTAGTSGVSGGCTARTCPPLPARNPRTSWTWSCPPSDSTTAAALVSDRPGGGTSAAAHTGPNQGSAPASSSGFAGRREAPPTPPAPMPDNSTARGMILGGSGCATPSPPMIISTPPTPGSLSPPPSRWKGAVGPPTARASTPRTGISSSF